jgi:HK97 family phage prohead protease
VTNSRVVTFAGAANLLLSADADNRVIRGVAIPSGTVDGFDGSLYRFAGDSVTFNEPTPILIQHDGSKPIGRLIEASSTPRGVEVAFKVSKVPAGDEILTLAADGVMGLSVGLTIPSGGVRMSSGNVMEVSAANCYEISVTPVPVLTGAHIDSVSFAHSTNYHEGEVTVVTETLEVAPVTVNLDAQALGSAMAAAFSAMPTPQPVPLARITAEEPLYRFDGTPGRHGFVADLRDAYRGDSTAAQRLDEHLSATFAITTGNTTALKPTQNRPDLYVDKLRYSRPLGSLISTGTLADGTPFTIPRFANAAGLVGDHTEGVEPTPGNFNVDDVTVTPRAISGKAEINREAWDRGGNPAIDTLVWNEMVAGYYESLEAKVATMLDALTLTAVAITGADADVVDAVTGQLIAAQFARGGNRFSALALNQDLFTALATAVDGDGRKLLPLINPVNADGQTSGGFGRVAVGGLNGVPAYGLTDSSYLFVPTSVYQLSTPPTRFDFNVRVKSVDLGIWGYHVEFVTRATDVVRLDYTA